MVCDYCGILARDEERCRGCGAPLAQQTLPLVIKLPACLYDWILEKRFLDRHFEVTRQEHSARYKLVWMGFDNKRYTLEANVSGKERATYETQLKWYLRRPSK